VKCREYDDSDGDSDDDSDVRYDSVLDREVVCCREDETTGVSVQ
jgi:hypothetical protein